MYRIRATLVMKWPRVWLTNVGIFMLFAFCFRCTSVNTFCNRMYENVMQFLSATVIYTVYNLIDFTDLLTVFYIHQDVLHAKCDPSCLFVCLFVVSFVRVFVRTGRRGCICGRRYRRLSLMLHYMLVSYGCPTKPPCDKTPSTVLNFGWHLTVPRET